MTTATFEGGVIGIRVIRGVIATRVEHCDTFSKFDWEHFVTSSSPFNFGVFQVAGVAGSRDLGISVSRYLPRANIGTRLF